MVMKRKKKTQDILVKITPINEFERAQDYLIRSFQNKKSPYGLQTVIEEVT